jgi:hypothetical protein
MVILLRVTLLVMLFAAAASSAPALAPTQRLILFALLLTAGVSAVGWSRAKG